MDVSNEEQSVSSTPVSGIPRSMRDTRRPYEKQLAVYLILASYIFERIAFLSLEYGLFTSLISKGPLYLNWSGTQASAASYIFSGK